MSRAENLEAEGMCDTSNPGSRPSPRDRRPATNAPSSVWDAVYKLDGSVKVGRGPFEQAFSLPPAMTSRWEPHASSLTFLTQGDRPTDVLGIDMELSSAAADEIRRMWFIVPMEWGSRTYGFSFARPLPWMSLSVGAVARAATEDGRYDVVLHRASTGSWRFDIRESDSGPGGWDEFEAGFLEISGDAVRPPWARVHLHARAEGTAGSFEADLRLNR